MGIIRKLMGMADSSGEVSDLTQQTGKTVGQSGFNQRLQNISKQAKIDEQLFYEKWVVKESWLLKHEALPLMFCIDPESNGSNLRPEQQNNVNLLWGHAKKCVEQGLLKVINQEQAEENWRVSPLDIYHWARVSRIEVPDVLDRLMEFVSKTIKQPELQKSLQNNSGKEYDCFQLDKNREKVLGIALALLAAYPEKCKNSRGQVKADNIVNLINEKNEFWSGNESLGLSTTAIRDLINKWLNTLPSTSTNV